MNKNAVANQLEPQLVKLDSFHDLRGSFTKLFCSLDVPVFDQVNQVNIVKNSKKGTLRGLHFQTAEFSESKLLYVLRGSIYDCVIDLRPSSTKYLKVQHFSISANDNSLLFIPEGHAHGYQTTESDTDVLYLHSQHYQSEAESGINYLDPTLSIKWPLDITVISNRDLNLPFLDAANEV